MGASSALIRKLDGLEPDIKDAFLYLIEEIEEKTKIVTVGSSDFQAMRDTVQRLAEGQERLIEGQERLTDAQERTENKLGALTDRVDKLAEGQERLTEAQERTENKLGALTDRVDKLAEGQERLTEAQERTENKLGALTDRFDNLAKAQEEMSKSMTSLIMDQRDIRRQLGGLAMSVGYGIEDKLIPKMEAAVQAEFGVTVSLVDRRNVIYDDGRYDEINIYCEGIRDGKSVYVIGEAKAQPGKKDFENFSKVLNRLHDHLKCDIEAFMVGYQYSPDVEIYADEHYSDIRRYKTFQLLKY